MRGNPLRARYALPRIGSIPAYAGEPQEEAVNAAQQAVYPRVCGGTGRRCICRMTAAGLSPRMRGNRYLLGIPMAGDRSIPAYAGEPYFAAAGSDSAVVYPRVCGGTRLMGTAVFSGQGLSPRMRGNQSADAARRVGRRSIPAYAGEPACAVSLSQSLRVYPRVCGGTRPPAAGRPIRHGLSPRMRGNLRG